jgi:hypothetical protein
MEVIRKYCWFVRKLEIFFVACKQQKRIMGEIAIIAINDE